MNMAEKKIRFMKEAPKIRLLHIAADFLRISSLLEKGMNFAIKPIVYESKHLAEWAAPELPLADQSFLSEAQSYLALKELQWDTWIANTDDKEGVSKTVRKWSNDLIKRAGIVE